MREIHVFDVDGTLVDTREATLAAYEAAAPGLFKDEYWGLPAQDWGCTEDVHLRKVAEFARLEHLIKPAWAMPMFKHAFRVGHHCLLLTGASEETMDVHRNRFKDLNHVDCHCGLSAEDKHRYLADLVRSNLACMIHYYDDAPWSVREAIVGDLGVQEHAPSDIDVSKVRVVVLAAGLGSRFRATGIPKPLIEFQGVSMISRARITACEVDPMPIVVCAKEIVSAVPPTISRITPGVTQRGPAESALLAGACLHPRDPVVFLDCDTCFSPGTLYEFVRRALASDTDCAVLTADRGDKVGRYGTIGNMGASGVLDITEGGDGNVCVTGAYYVSSWHAFRCAHARLYLHTPLDKELKLGTLLASIGATQRGLVPIQTDTRNWIPLGTPEELDHASKRTM